MTLVTVFREVKHVCVCERERAILLQMKEGVYGETPEDIFEGFQDQKLIDQGQMRLQGQHRLVFMQEHFNIFVGSGDKEAHEQREVEQVSEDY